MVGYDEFVTLSQSRNSEERGMAAHFAALAYLNHRGPADEQAALYAALFGFLEDPSVKVRAAMAYGLLHAACAPRPIMLALLHDSAVIARAVLQYSPVLIDADILPLVAQFDEAMLLSAAQRQYLSSRLAEALIARDILPVTVKVLRRSDISLEAALLRRLATEMAGESGVRGAMLERDDLPPDARFYLVAAVARALKDLRMVKGAIAPERLERVLRNAADTALTRIGEHEGKGARAYARTLAAEGSLNTRVLLHAVINGHVFFFAACCAELSETPAEKVFAVLETGSRAALNALFTRCGLSEGVRNLLARLICHARTVDLADDAAARHYVVTALTEELIAEHGGVLPDQLGEAFAYLGEQNVLLARQAAKGVMAGFVGTAQTAFPAVEPEPEQRLALPAA